VVVSYEDLSVVFDVEEAIAPGAPLVDPRHGNNWFTYGGHHAVGSASAMSIRRWAKPIIS
jgi:CO/xanthine dehydrogenase Mo-binding subunit